MPRPIEITAHALRRYGERVLALDFTPALARRLSEPASVRWAEGYYGIAFEDVSKSIRREVEDALPMTVRSRGSRVRIKGSAARYVIEDGYCVVTVLPLDDFDDRNWPEKRHEQRHPW